MMRYAFRNIFRLKMRSLLSLLITFSIFFLAMFGFFIRSLCENNRDRFYGPLDGSVHVTNEKLEPYLTYEAAVVLCDDADVITRVSAVKEYTGFFRDALYVGYGTYKRSRYSGEELTEDRKSNYRKGICISAVTSMDILKDVYGGDLEMIEGTMITNRDTEEHQNKIVISKALAEGNGLSLGDRITLDMLSIFQIELEAVRFGLTDGLYDEFEFGYEYIVGGIYTHRKDNAAAVSEPWKLNANTVYVPISTIVDISYSECVQHLFRDDGYYALNVNPCVIPDALYLHLADIGEVDALSAEIDTIGFSETVKLTEFVSDTSSSPSARLSGIISAVLVGVIAVGFVVLMLSVLFHMKARHRELAVLIALGKKRSAVIVSFFLEFAVLVFFSLLLSGAAMVFTAALCTAPLSEYLYSAELSAKFQSESADFYLFGDAAEELISQKTASFHALVANNIIPSVGVAWVAAALLIIFLYFIMRWHIGRINPLYDVGGKE